VVVISAVLEGQSCAGALESSGQKDDKRNSQQPIGPLRFRPRIGVVSSLRAVEFVARPGRAGGAFARITGIPCMPSIRRRGYEPDQARTSLRNCFTSLSKNARSPRRPSQRPVPHLAANLRSESRQPAMAPRPRAQARRRLHLCVVRRSAGGEPVRAEPVDAMSPERLFDRRWALVCWIGQCSGLKGSTLRRARAPSFEALQVFLSGAKVPRFRIMMSEPGLA